MLPLPAPPGIASILVYIDVISCEVHDLLDMDILEMHSLTPCTITLRLLRRIVVHSRESNGIERVDDWFVPLTRYGGHLYAKIPELVRKFFANSS